MRANGRTKASAPVAGSCNVPCFKRDLVARLCGEQPAAEHLESVRAAFAGLADGPRLKILYALRHGEELCVCDVAHVLGTTVSTASHHLRRLRDLKFLKYRNDGKMAYYSLRDRLAIDLVMQCFQQMKP